MALLSDPVQAPHTLLIMNKIADDLCQFADIKATRLDWYVERGALIALVGAVELFMLTDVSEKFADTKSFLSRSLDTYVAIKSSSFCSPQAFQSAFAGISQFVANSPFRTHWKSTTPPTTHSPSSSTNFNTNADTNITTYTSSSSSSSSSSQ
jgi:hypothetical protein